jgi:hypothetical protein
MGGPVYVGNPTRVFMSARNTLGSSLMLKGGKDDGIEQYSWLTGT